MADVPAPTPQNTDGIWIILIVSFIFFAWVSNGGPSKFEERQGATRLADGGTSVIRSTSERETTARTSPSSPVTQTSSSDLARSPYAGKVVISSKGSAASAIQVNQENITIRNNTRSESISITGWTVKNGRENRLFPTSSSTLQVRYQSDRVAIPTGARILTGTQANFLTPVVLGPREQAYLVTGKMPNQSPYAVPVSFKLNKCIGYLEALPPYNFSPRASANCPAPSKEPELASLEQSCYNYVRRLSVCHTPVFEVRDGIDYVDKTTGLSGYCKSYVKKRFSYSGCLAQHVADNDFTGTSWYIYLNYPQQLWDVNREHISLYDAQGRLVDELSY